MTATVRPYRDEDLSAWRALNEGWLAEAGFVIEAKDRQAIERPRATILETGGMIFVAELDGAVVGCCALLARDDGGFEVAKMAVAPVARRNGTGLRLLEACQGAAIAHGARRLYLETSFRLVAARALYRRFGFVDLPPRPSPYARAEVFMEKSLAR
ncbi:GNAT family N-acetyltransferase [Brevundimonas diminuta]|uniref:N-acetyltransferase n=1 Tax=Brevundimonas diminuta TaxID=293 RepID=A0A1Z3LVN2_BREDI|nr:GNAT family N-acetyltransferase [Brevundimonas diminuta]ASD26240.1 N-acetyltransferase [Brevundimonas diminuta]